MKKLSPKKLSPKKLSPKKLSPKKLSPKKPFLKTLGNKIIEERGKRNMSQVELAHICNKDAQSLERVENGKVNPSAFYLYEIAEGLEISIKSFFDFNINK